MIMADSKKNSFDLLRLFAALLVLFSHQHVLLGIEEPKMFGWTTFGGIGVSIFFVLSGFLVWSSWARDPDLKRFFIRRSLRIFPALWFVVLASVLVFGPFLSELSVLDYFASSGTWRYLSTALLLIRQGLPGVFTDNFFPLAVNGSLWTLPVEFLCYVLVALVGSIGLPPRSWPMFLSLGLAVVAAAFGSLLLGPRFVSHLEMVALFWWGVMYAFVRGRQGSEYKVWAVAMSLFFVAFAWLGSRGIERGGILVLVALVVLVAQRVSWGARITDRLGDLSYGMYIFAFPMQQMVVALGRNRGWTFATHLSLSLLLTSVLAYVSWHVLEKRALRFKPHREVTA